jgi:hypothetical protein
VADIINLRRVRKHKAREADETIAAENRVKFGQKKSDRNLQDSLKQQANSKLDGHKRDHD